MKKPLIILLTLFISTTVFGQFGIKAGANITNVSTENTDLEDLEAKLGYQAGIMQRINIGNSFAIQPELMYIRKINRYNLATIDVDSRLDYFELPILFIIKPNNFPVQLQVGPQFSYLLGTKVLFEGGDFEFEEGYELDRESFEDIDYGFVLGLGFVILDKVTLDLRYTRGLKEIERGTTIDDLTIEPASKLFGFQASIGYLF